ncbi:probable 2' cyclic ADP-D-ribose synthase BdTIR [Phragmites australis]|uniref:probable 2' cyclic ADP-D-ribose synthase BdTIR n=1 Tax=Phragmites australis TaxID=29695 RepID=UPI002D795B19|nr:probable 2' cyclic ADP-D-ribose synthase BdTIR [Phragmites australis]
MASGLSRRSMSQSIASRLNESAEATTKAKKPTMVEHDDEEVAGRRPRYDVFINHRGVDTKRTVARLLYDRLAQLSGDGIRSFLDNMSMRPGDRLEERIFEAVRECSVAVAIFSPRYCDSEFCLRELAKLVEARKTIIPIFYDIKPSELILPQAVVDSKDHLPRDIEGFRFALREAKYTVGLCYDSATGDLAELVSAAANAVVERIEELEKVQRQQMIVSRL